MRPQKLLSQAALTTSLVTLLVGAAFAQEITLQADPEVRIRPLVEKFNAESPDIKVKLEDISYQTTVESLPIQLASGQGPDMAVVTDLGGLSKYYLDVGPYVDKAYFETQFGQSLAWLRGSQGGDAINGVPITLTVNGAFANATLFEQAGVELPEEGATWEDWAQASKAVADATGLDFAMEIDRSGHRFASLAISYGAELVDEQGNPVVDEGLRQAIETFAQWHRDGIMPMDLWGAIGGSTHRDNFADFINAKVPFYFSGSWKLSPIDKDIGGLFEWRAVATPCGPSSCTAMPGGNALVGWKHTRQPEAVAKFLEFAAQEENLEYYLSTAVYLPTASSLVEKGIDYQGAPASVNEAMALFTQQIPKMAPAAHQFQGWAYQRAMMNAMTTRISQVLNNELDVDTALKRIKEDVELAISAGK
ncbi:extracellular solute-binding protein [Paracoccus sp. S3-43]|uniref:ABC transporter substrate-binding protein n=1 Tax=Paracoccus sp. S3-43 TaxID=3030011 RepID=UPI0023B12E54|nr:extracellular solute-binding protein [Paracoccus sp. S3-43]WEF25156.1 extracellular solute-binding protein [Paracoccus sp. S3-43]